MFEGVFGLGSDFAKKMVVIQRKQCIMEAICHIINRYQRVGKLQSIVTNLFRGNWYIRKSGETNTTKKVKITDKTNPSETSKIRR